MEKLTVLLGTGATMPDVPGVWEVTQQLKAWGLFRCPDVTRSVPNNSLIEQGTNDARKTLFSWIAERIDNERRGDSHFEEHLHALELLASFYPYPKDPAVVDAYRPLLGPFVTPDPSVSHDEFGGAAEEAGKKVLEIMSAACDRVQQAGLHVLASGLQRLAVDYQLGVFSLNYDDVPEHGSIQYSTGFELTNGRFSPSTLVGGGLPGHVHAQLHGSVMWSSSLDGFRRHSTRGDALAARVGRGSSGTRHQDGHQSPRVPIVTGLRKADKVLSDPFRTYQIALQQQLIESERWLLVGYGGADEHINAALSLASAIRSERNQFTRVAIIDRSTHLNQRGVFMTSHGYPTYDVLDRALKNWNPAAFMQYVQAVTLQEMDQYQLNPIVPGLEISLDGTAWALGPGLQSLQTYLA